MQAGFLTLARSGYFTVTTEHTHWHVCTRPLEVARFLDIANTDISDPVAYYGDADFLKAAPQIVARRRAEIRNHCVRNSYLEERGFLSALATPTTPL